MGFIRSRRLVHSMRNTNNIPLSKIKSALERLTPMHQRRWGKMSVEQMLDHLVRFSEITLGKRKVGWMTGLAGKIAGKKILKWILSKNHLTFPKNIGTFPEVMPSKDQLNFEQQRTRLVLLLNELEQSTGTLQHPIYGKISTETAQKLFSIHVAYHLVQFGCDFQES